MQTYGVLRVDYEGKLFLFETKATIPDDHQRPMIVITDDDQDNYSLINSSGWNFDKKNKVLSDNKGNTLITDSKFDILQITTFFLDVLEAINASFDKNQHANKRIHNIITSLTKNKIDEEEINKNKKIKELSSQKHGSAIRIGKQIKKIENYEYAFERISKIIENTHHLDKKFSAKIISLIESSKIANHKTGIEIIEILNSKHFLPKKQAIRNILNM